jgi:hypothetical protein
MPPPQPRPQLKIFHTPIPNAGNLYVAAPVRAPEIVQPLEPTFHTSPTSAFASAGHAPVKGRDTLAILNQYEKEVTGLLYSLIYLLQ